MTISRLSLYAIGLTLTAVVFILVKGIPDGPIFWNLLALDLPAAGLMLVVLLFGYWSGEQRPGGANWVEQLLMALDRQRYAVAFVVWVVLCAGSLWVYRNHPLSMDEYSAVFPGPDICSGGAPWTVSH